MLLSGLARGTVHVDYPTFGHVSAIAIQALCDSSQISGKSSACGGDCVTACLPSRAHSSLEILPPWFEPIRTECFSSVLATISWGKYSTRSVPTRSRRVDGEIPMESFTYSTTSPYGREIHSSHRVKQAKDFCPCKRGRLNQPGGTSCFSSGPNVMFQSISR